jgi:fluoroacetyl-CoA thioesterase
MKPGLSVGETLTRSIVVDRARTIDFLGETLRIYSTPQMVLDAEQTCRHLILPWCDPGEDSVGTGIALSHKGSTLLGMTVEVTATVKAVDGRRVSLAVSVRDAIEEISSGDHGRFVVQIDKVRERVMQKKKTVEGGA